MKKTIIIVFILILQNCFAQNGILDSSFGSGGLKTFSLVNRNTRGNHLITFSDNSFIIAGNSDGAVARVRVSFFYLLIGMFLIAFVEKLMP